MGKDKFLTPADSRLISTSSLRSSLIGKMQSRVSQADIEHVSFFWDDKLV